MSGVIYGREGVRNRESGLIASQPLIPTRLQRPFAFLSLLNKKKKNQTPRYVRLNRSRLKGQEGGDEEAATGLSVLYDVSSWTHLHTCAFLVYGFRCIVWWDVVCDM